MKNIVAALAGGAAADTLWTDGLHVAGERYVVFKVEGRSIYGRKVSFLPIPPLFAARLILARRRWPGRDLTSYRVGMAS